VIHSEDQGSRELYTIGIARVPRARPEPRAYLAGLDLGAADPDATVVITVGSSSLFTHRGQGRGLGLLGERLPLSGCALLVSGRASFELAQKTVLAGIPVLAAVSAPASLAVELAEKAGLTLVGFLRGPSKNVYTGSHRLSA
jgi:hypothetical protein